MSEEVRKAAAAARRAGGFDYQDGLVESPGLPGEAPEVEEEVAEAPVEEPPAPEEEPEDDPEEMTKEELYDLAQEYDIPGRSSMSKEELLEAVEAYEAS